MFQVSVFVCVCVYSACAMCSHGGQGEIEKQTTAMCVVAMEAREHIVGFVFYVKTCLMILSF